MEQTIKNIKTQGKRENYIEDVEMMLEMNNKVIRKIEGDTKFNEHFWRTFL